MGDGISDFIREHKEVRSIYKKNWEKFPSVTPGGKKFFLIKKTSYGIFRVVWDRVERKYVTQRENNIMGLFQSEVKAKRCVDDFIKEQK